MRFNIKKTEKNVALLNALASKNRSEAQLAHESLAAFLGPILSEVIDTAPTLSNMFQNFEFNENDNPSIPLDLYVDVEETGFIKVWSQQESGGMPYNMPTPPTKELKFSTYTLDSAVSFNKKHARQGRLDVLGKTMEKLAQEIMLIQETNSAGVILRALAQATSTVGGAEVPHIIRSTAADQFVLHDFNRLFTLLKRVNSSWNGGTPARNRGRGLTDIIVSPEVIQELHGMAYNPINTKGGPVGTAGTNAIPLTDAMRDQIYKTAGIPEFFGVNIMEIHELGVGYAYNDLFGYFAGATEYPGHNGGAASAFDPETEELIIGLDLVSYDSLIRPVALDTDSQSSFVVQPDDQHFVRSGKFGFYGSLEEGRVILRDKVLSGVIL